MVVFPGLSHSFGVLHKLGIGNTIRDLFKESSHVFLKMPVLRHDHEDLVVRFGGVSRFLKESLELVHPTRISAQY